MTDDRMQLTRRKILAGASAIGVAGVGAGLGTSALFSDEESFEDNIVAAGELNMLVSADVAAQNSAMPQVEIEGENEQDTADGNTVTITASDVKPGDWWLIEWNIRSCTNPAHVQVTSVDGEYENREGENPEPETDTDGDGDLGGALLTSIWNSHPSTTNGDRRQDLEGLDETTNLSGTELASYETPDLGGETSGGAHYTTMDEAHDVYSTGVTLRNSGTGEPAEVGCEDGQATYYQLFELPPEVGNDVQGDVIEFTLRFNAEQARNNDDPFNSTS